MRKSIIKAALLTATVFAASVFSQEDTARVLFRIDPAEGLTTVKVVAAPGDGGGGTCVGMERDVTPKASGRDTVFLVFTSEPSSVRHGSQQRDAPAFAGYNRGNVSLKLNPRQYKDAAISMHAVNGKRILHGRASASNGTFAVSRNNVAPGMYILSVRGVQGNSFAAKIAHNGGRLNINADFGVNSSLRKQAAVSDCGTWTLTFSAEGFSDRTVAIDLNNLNIGAIAMTKAPIVGGDIFDPPGGTANFTDSVGSIKFDMVYIPGGTINLGCQTGNCYYQSSNATATVSPYYIAKNQVTQTLWTAVMGSGHPASRPGDATWYESHEFACRLSQITGKNYRMMTEAEWEYAAVNHASSLSDLNTGNNMQGEEWAYNSWSGSHSGGTDPVGPTGDSPSTQSLHDQKTRRNAAGVGDHIRGRLIRSIEGIGPQTRLVLSANVTFPPNYVPPCEIRTPHMDDSDYPNSYRDSRWVTGSDSMWRATGMMAQSGFGGGSNFQLRVWANGTARISTGYGNPVDGQWFSSNNINFVFVPNNLGSPSYPGSTDTVAISRFAYIFVDLRNMSVVSAGTHSYTGRLWKVATASATPPNITNLAANGEALARSLGDKFETDYKMVDMQNMPTTEQDPRLFDESVPGQTNYGWAQINQGSAHHYRKDIDADEFRFVVSGTMLSNGSWFTINNTFLRVRHPGGTYQSCFNWNGQNYCQTNTYWPYEVDYLYVFTREPGGTQEPQFYHNSFQGYERGDYRTFTRTPNSSSSWNGMGEIAKDQGPSSMYATHRLGASTFKPAPCPASGCN